jgi:UTP--glucose-1-phosphate uridylyltransferase
MVKKVVIPVAGLGTRMLPATKAIAKELLPLVDRPLIQFVVEECAAAGLTEIIFVTHSSKGAIENHFDSHFELETSMELRGKDKLVSELRSLLPKGVTIAAVRQSQAKGLGHAVLCARSIVGNEPFAVVLPDVLVDASSCDLSRDNLAEMVANFNAHGVAQVMLEQVPKHLTNQYGIADLDGRQLVPGEQAPIKRLVEKPPTASAPSDLAVVGRYVFPAALWPLLEQTRVGAGGEIQLTDAMAMLLEQQPVHAYYMKGRSNDCGNKLGYAQAFVEQALRHPSIGAEMRQFLANLKLS